jgi:hypothetical protein
MGEESHAAMQECDFLTAPEDFVGEGIFTAPLRDGIQVRIILGFVGNCGPVEWNHRLTLPLRGIISQLIRFLNKNPPGADGKNYGAKEKSCRIRKYVVIYGLLHKKKAR